MAKNTGISATNLILVGGLAALLLDKNLRNRVVGGTRHAYNHGMELLEDELIPALADAAEQAEQQARRLAREGNSRLNDFDGGELLGLAGDFLGKAQKQALRFARDNNLDDAAGSVMSFFDGAGDSIEEQRNNAERSLRRARKDIEREMRRRNLSPAKLEKAVSRKLAPIQKNAQRELARFERDVTRQRRMAAAQSSGSSAGFLLALGVVGAGVAVLSQSREARILVMDGIEKVSPDARHHLQRVGRSFKYSLGEFWMEEEKAPATVSTAPKPEAKPQAKNDDAREGNVSQTPTV